MALKGHSLKHGYGLMLAKASGHGGRPNHHRLRKGTTSLQATQAFQVRPQWTTPPASPSLMCKMHTPAARQKETITKTKVEEKATKSKSSTPPPERAARLGSVAHTAKRSLHSKGK
jgi:hypothetical protein